MARQTKKLDSAKVSIVILNWNGLTDTIECLESVRKIDYPNYEVVVVDNASTDGSPAKIAKRFPWVTLIRNKQNLGFAAGNNVGIRHALKNGAEYIYMLNNDTKVDKDILNAFVGAAASYPDAGIFGAKIYFYSDPERIWSAGGTWNSKKMSFDIRGYGAPDAKGEYDAFAEIDYACGCALFFRREVVESIGLFDKRFFLTFEESDWCYRARRAGYKILYVPQAKVWHKVHASFGGFHAPLYEYFLSRNRLLWAQSHLPWKDRLSLYSEIITKYFPNVFTTKGFPLVKRLYWDVLKNIKDLKQPQCKAKYYGILDFALKRFGNCRPSVKKLHEEWKRCGNSGLK